jgi:hypothetical protein
MFEEGKKCARAVRQPVLMKAQLTLQSVSQFMKIIAAGAHAALNSMVDFLTVSQP